MPRGPPAGDHLRRSGVQVHREHSVGDGVGNEEAPPQRHTGWSLERELQATRGTYLWP